MCACGGGNTSGGPLLTGTLDPIYADSGGGDNSQSQQVAQAGLASGFAAPKFFSIGFWVIVVIVIGAAVVAEVAKKRAAE